MEGVPGDAVPLLNDPAEKTAEEEKKGEGSLADCRLDLLMSDRAAVKVTG